MKTLAHTTTYSIIECGHVGCGVSFALADAFIAARRDDHATWYCPNGHTRWYPEKNAVETERASRERAERQAAYARQSAAAWRDQAEAAHRQATAYKGHATRLRRRAAAGVCPCCNRSFADLGRHMAGQHPDFGT